jgi:hypothetical protein
MFPGWAADRAIRYERGVRDSAGVPAVARKVRERFGRHVLAGPFVGMELADGFEESVASPVLKLLGQYEPVFHQPLERAISLRPQVVLNIGCADGYYAVGLARRLPDARVAAFDLARAARRATERLADTNCAHVTVDGRCSFISDDVGLVVCDIEGGEDELLAPDRLRLAVVLVETHDGARPGVTDRLEGRFSATHDVERLKPRPVDETAILWLTEAERKVALDEMRGDERQNWVAMWPRVPTAVEAMRQRPRQVGS